ncbi:EAL domain-containing protein [Marinactinospora thermotolerans]|uniref:EAL domain, c-di-GMP-specific phosphodiesterase class I (Or its enzymatically inactive variant) n=1 Tax=Marinactinospora thermotolerans DSM 45154 TaxID=1122192 RepID=A0A1T4S3M7_9ACTN|nr:EAL domain-containing protein [Marinactinospora thermotolerans]SKA22900.1 EAL domain, c-di-GMP-specific phosphodiesterase class I (or its enzymatically inactive variant) [Marinactinospora thermotolerans DSM 45154]
MSAHRNPLHADAAQSAIPAGGNSAIGESNESPPLRPIVDLDSGAVLAIDVIPFPDGAAAGDVPAQAERLARLTRRVAAHETLLPLVLPVPALLVAAGREPFALLEHTLRRAGRRPREVTLMIGPELRDLPRDVLLRGTGYLREMGFRCALGTAQVAPDLLLEAAPFLFRIDPGLVAGVPGDERLTAVVEGLARIGRGSGVFPLAAEVRTAAQAVALRRAGVRLAQGPLFADEGWRPGDRVTPVPEATLDGTAPGLETGPRVAEFVVPAVTLPEEATAEEVLEAFTNDPALNSVILIDHRERPVASLDRARFLLAITGPYGHALHAKRPARRLADTPRTVARGLPALAALRSAGADRDRVYDDVISVNEFGQCMGVVHVSDLIRSLSGN